MTMIYQTDLFNTNPQVAGFKLDYMEVWNWGTFNDKVFRLNPQGNNALLTGANASGKSTLIDALLTLLVPLKRQRFYNQSSGAEKKVIEQKKPISSVFMIRNKKAMRVYRH